MIASAQACFSAVGRLTHHAAAGGSLPGWPGTRDSDMAHVEGRIRPRITPGPGGHRDARRTDTASPTHDDPPPFCEESRAILLDGPALSSHPGPGGDSAGPVARTN